MATKQRGRHYANKEKAAQISTTTSTYRATVSNESLDRRLKSTRFQNTRYASPSRYNSPSRTRENASNDMNNNNGYAATSSPLGRDRTPTRSVNEMELVQGISDRLDTGLNEDALGAILDLLKRGEHPDAIVAVVTSLAQQQSR